MNTNGNGIQSSGTLARLFAELVNGANVPGGAFILNSGDVGLLRSLDKLSASDASHSSNGGATVGSIAHLAYHLGAIRQIAKSARGPKEGTFQ